MSKAEVLEMLDSAMTRAQKLKNYFNLNESFSYPIPTSGDHKLNEEIV